MFTVINLPPKHSTPSDQRLPDADRAVLRLLEDDWRQMCGGDLVPRQGQLDPHALHDALPHAFVLQRTAPRAIRIRVAGQRLHDLLRMDPRGMSAGSFFTDAARVTVLNIIDSAFDAPAVVALPLRAARGLGRKPILAELLLLPMQDSAGQITRMMGALVAAGPLGHRALRFDIATDVPMRHDAMNMPFQERRSSRAKPVPAQPARLRLVARDGQLIDS